MAQIDDYAEFLSEAATSAIAIVHEFRILYAADDNSFHAFLEGAEDRLFYLPEIRRRIGENGPLHNYVCNGKPRLTEVRAEIRQLALDSGRYLFFVDRDYDDFLNRQIELDDRTYITDFYSIESNVSTIEAIEILLSDFGGMSRRDPLFNQIIDAYQLALNDFAKRMRPFSAWIIAMRERGGRPNLNNVNLANLFEFDHRGTVKKKKDAFNTFRRNVGLENELNTCLPTLKWERRLRAADPKKWIRGKYLSWFFRSYLLSLILDLSSRSNAKWKIPSPLREDRIFEALGGRLTIPGSLDNFLNQTCCG